MSKLMENASPDDDILYSMNSDISDTNSDEAEDDSVSVESDLSCESADDEGVTTNISELLKCNLPFYDGELKLSTDFESKIPRNASPIVFFSFIFYTKISFLHSGSIELV
jgi:hypothetical protein